MPKFSRFMLAVPAAAMVGLLAACSSAPQRDTAELANDLQKDLELAKASSLELASSSRARTEVISGIEAGRAGATLAGDRAPLPKPAPRARPEVTPVVRHTAQKTVEAPVATVAEETPAPATEEVVAPAATVAAAPAPEPAAAPTPEPVVLAGPQATEDGVGASRPRDPGGWGDASTGNVGGGGSGGGWGGLAGVIIRGGSIGDGDHCEIRPRRGSTTRRGTLPGSGTVYVPRAGGTGGSAGRGSVTPRARGGSSGGGAVSAPSAGRTRSRGGQ